MDKQLAKNIVFTLAYFEAMNYPLTLFELWRHMFQITKKRQRYTFCEVKDAVEEKQLSAKITKKDGMLFLNGGERLVKERSVANKFSISKLKKLKLYAKIFAIVPYVRGVFLTGTLSMKNAKQNSDWDVLMVLAKNRIWLGRFFLAVTLQLIGKRRHGNKVKERFCLNHYITENGLILEEHNEFSANFVSNSMPILGGAIYKKFLQMNEFWIQTIKPNYKKEEISENDVETVEHLGTKQKIQATVEAILEKSGIAKLANAFVKEIMIKKIKQNPKTYWENADIRYGETALVFLPKPHRITMLEKTKERLAVL
jgi:hypothetical protein